VTRFLIYLLLFGTILYLLSWWGRRQSVSLPSKTPLPPPKANRWFRPQKNPGEIWVQVYETASVDEGRILQARLQEEEVECVLYEQGRKDIHGNALKGIGIAVPKTAASHAQRIISRMPT
jgi:hypothetical protein